MKSKKSFNPRRPYVSASELGAVYFCARAYYYNVNRAPSSYINSKQRLRGKIAHEQLSEEVRYEQRNLGIFRRFIRWLFGWMFR